MNEVEQVLDEVQKSESFDKAEHQGMIFQKQLDELGMTFAASDSSTLIPYKTDAAMVAGEKINTFISFCIYNIFLTH